MSSTRPALTSSRLIATLILGAALGGGSVLLIERRSDSSRHVTLTANAPSGSLIAFVADQSCGGRPCQSLSVGQSESNAVSVETLHAQSASEIVWTPDGKRVGFVIDGRELWLYDAGTRTLAGRVGLLTADAAHSRLARGITFSENGRAVTFDDCPKRQSGCRAGFVGVPQ